MEKIWSGRSAGALDKYAVRVGGGGELLNVQHGQRGVGDGLAKDGPGIGTERRVQLFRRTVGRNKCAGDTHLGHGDGNQVECAPVDAGGRHDVVPAGGNIEQREEIRRLA